MPLLIGARRAQLKPPLGAILNRAHPLAQGVLAAFAVNELGGQVLNDAVGRFQLSGSGTTKPTWAASPYGPAVDSTGSTNNTMWQSATLSSGVSYAGITLAGIGMQRGGNTNGRILTVDDGSAGAFLQLYIANGAVTVQTTGGTLAVSPNQTNGTWYLYAATYTSSGSVGYYIPLGGGAVVSGSSALTGAPTIKRLTLGNRWDGVRNWDGQLTAAFLWNRALSQAELRQLAADPYAMWPEYSPARWSILLPGGQTFNQTVSATQAQSVALQNQVNLIRADSQAQAVALLKTVTLLRADTQTQSATSLKTVQLIRADTQAQSVALQKQANLIRTIGQSQAVALVKQVNLIRAITQAQAATVIALKVLLRSVTTTQAQAVALLKQVNLPRSATQPQAVSLLKQVQLIRTVPQSQTLALPKSITLTRAITQAQSVARAVQANLIRLITQTQLASVLAGLVGPTKPGYHSVSDRALNQHTPIDQPLNLHTSWDIPPEV